jgi:hypothetical protein
MDKQEARQAEIDARHQESLAWRNNMREEDKQWRQELREGERSWRQTLREEDKAWRTQTRNEDIENRARAERVAKRCCALSAAAQSLPPETAPEKIFALAAVFAGWLDKESK